MKGTSAAPKSSIESYVVWTNEQTRVASFHAVDGFHSQSFHLHEFFMSYLSSLQERGYRFQ